MKNMSIVRVTPPAKAGIQSSVTVEGATYHALPGTTLDVAACVADMLVAHGWVVVPIAPAAAPRPTKEDMPSGVLPQGFKIFDAALGKTIVYAGDVWRDPITGNLA